MTKSLGEVDDHGLVPAAALAAYDLLPEDGWRLDHVRTLHNSVFSLTRPSEDQPAWALRLHRTGWRSADQISAELAMLEFLDRHLPTTTRVPAPRRTRTGDLVVEASGRLYSLLAWIPGTPARPDTGLDRADVELLGEGLGAIHTALDGWPDSPAAPARWDADALFTAASPGLMGTAYSMLDDVLDPTERRLFAEVADRSRIGLPITMAARHASMCLWLLGNVGPDQAPDLDHIRLRMGLAPACLAIDPAVFVGS